MSPYHIVCGHYINIFMYLFRQWDHSYADTISRGDSISHDTAFTKKIQRQNESNIYLMRMNENELYWPGMFTHTRNLL